MTSEVAKEGGREEDRAGGAPGINRPICPDSMGPTVCLHAVPLLLLPIAAAFAPSTGSTISVRRSFGSAVKRHGPSTQLHMLGSSADAGGKCILWFLLLFLHL